MNLGVDLELAHLVGDSGVEFIIDVYLVSPDEVEYFEKVVIEEVLLRVCVIEIVRKELNGIIVDEGAKEELGVDGFKEDRQHVEGGSIEDEAR